MIGSLHQHHRAIELLKLHKTIDHNVPPGLDVHLVLDNASSRKPPTIGAWLAPLPVPSALHAVLLKLDQPR